MDVSLHDLGAFHASVIGHRDGNGDLVAVCEDGAADDGCAIGEGCVGETMAEGEKRRDAHALVVPVADIEAFAVHDFEVLAGPVVEGWVVLESLRERCLAVISIQSWRTASTRRQGCDT